LHLRRAASSRRHLAQIRGESVNGAAALDRAAAAR
jgi:hypothetical protein